MDIELTGFGTSNRMPSGKCGERALHTLVWNFEFFTGRLNWQISFFSAGGFFFFGLPDERIRLLEEELRRLSERYQLQIEELQTLLQASELRLRLIEENLQLGNRQ